MIFRFCLFIFFFFNDTATTEIYTLSLHDALPISSTSRLGVGSATAAVRARLSASSQKAWPGRQDRKSTRLNSSHGYISYAVFCLKKKKQSEPPSPHPSGHGLADSSLTSLIR